MMDLLILTGMLFVLMLPILAIPYIFIKLGSVAGRVQGMMNNVGRNARRSATGYAKDEAKLRGREAVAKYARDNPTKKTGRLANRLANRKRLMSGREAEVSRALEHAHYGNIAESDKYAQSAAGIGSVERVRNAARAHEEKVWEQDVAEAASGLKLAQTNSDTYDSLATGRIAASAAKKEAATRWVMSNGNFSQRRAVYESIDESTDSRTREYVSGQFYAKGDNAVMGSAYGGSIQAGTGKGRQGTFEAVAKTINDKKITPQAMAHDADATKLVEDVINKVDSSAISIDPATGKAVKKPAPIQLSTQLTNDGLGSVRKSAAEALTNETIKSKVTAEVFAEPIRSIAGSVPPTAPGPTIGGPAPASGPGPSGSSPASTPKPQPTYTPATPQVIQPRVSATAQNQINYTVNSSLPTPGGQPMQVRATSDQLLNQVYNNVGGWDRVSDDDLRRMFKETLRETVGKNPTNKQVEVLDMAEKTLRNRGYIQTQGLPGQPGDWTRDPRL